MDAFFKTTNLGSLNRNVTDLLVRLSIVALLVYWAALLVQPFLVLIAWSIILVIVLYPAYSWTVRRLHLPSVVASGAIVACCLVVLLGPVTWLGLSAGTSARWIGEKLASGELAIPPPFESVRKWPLVGTKTYDLWSLASTNLTAAVTKLGPVLRPLSTRLLYFAGSAGLSVFKFVVSIIVAGFLFKPGPALVETVGSVFRRLTAEHGDEYVRMVGFSVRNLARGVIGVAALQSPLVGLGLIVAGIPGAGLISLFVLVLGIIQIGSAIIIVPVVIWNFFTMDTFGAVLFALYMVPVSLVDNFLRPIVMAHGLKTPMPVILIGLLGGVWVHGLIGLFVGPVVLAIVWELVRIWIWQEPGESVSECRS
jgi:predicted PurR-regulated permease PerM